MAINPQSLLGQVLGSITSFATSLLGGVANAGAVPILNASGQLDFSMLKAYSSALPLIRPYGSYFGFLNFITAGVPSTAGQTTNTIKWAPFTVLVPTTVTNLGIVVRATNTASVNLGIYSNTDSLSYDAPNNLLTSTQVNFTAIGPVFAALPTPYVLQPGTLYWAAVGILGASTLLSFPQGSYPMIGYSSAGNSMIVCLQQSTTSTLPSQVTGAFTSGGVPSPLLYS
jgi:hypothetical protein